MYRHNSTIRIKQENCSRCGKLRPVYKRIKRDPYCEECARITNTLAAIEEDAEKEMIAQGLSELTERADEIYSKWLRASMADDDGRLNCYTCGQNMFWTAAQCGHFISRGIIYLRWDPRNTRPQCYTCNVTNRGNLVVFAQRLEEERPGIVDILKEDATMIYKPTRREINQIIVEHTIKFKKLK